MRARLVVAVAFAIVAASIFGFWRWYALRANPADAIRGSGIIEVTQVDVAFEVPGRVAERFVDEGAMLDRGEPVAQLDDREYRLQVERVAGAKAAAEARYRLMMRGPRAQEIDQALAALEAAESAFHLQQLDHDRIASLAGRGIVSQNELDRVSTALADARAARDRAASSLDLLREGFRTEEIEEARARLHEAGAALDLAQLNLDRCKLFAPASGRVLSKSREAGEMVQPGTPIVTLGDLTRPWVNLYVGERDLGKVRVGMKAYVTVDSFPDRPFEGAVSFISERAEFTPKNIQTPDERVKLVYRVKVELEPRDGALKPGMPADTFLPLDHEAAGAPQNERAAR
jgi:HlyD family secretion protein